MFNADLRDEFYGLRENVQERFIGHTAEIKRLVDDYEDRARKEVAALIGAKDYRQFDGDLDTAQRARVLKQVKADISETLKGLLLMIDNDSLKDQLIADLKDVRVDVYKKETQNFVDILAAMLPKGVTIASTFTDTEISELLRLPLAGLTTQDYIQKVLVELFFGIIQAVTLSFTDAKTFEGGIRKGLAGVGKKFETARGRLVKLCRELIMQASNIALKNVNEDFVVRKPK